MLPECGSSAPDSPPGLDPGSASNPSRRGPGCQPQVRGPHRTRFRTRNGPPDHENWPSSSPSPSRLRGSSRAAIAKRIGRARVRVSARLRLGRARRSSVGMLRTRDVLRPATRSRLPSRSRAARTDRPGDHPGAGRRDDRRPARARCNGRRHDALPHRARAADLHRRGRDRLLPLERRRPAAPARRPLRDPAPRARRAPYQQGRRVPRRDADLRGHRGQAVASVEARVRDLVRREGGRDRRDPRRRLQPAHGRSHRRRAAQARRDPHRRPARGSARPAHAPRAGSSASDSSARSRARCRGRRGRARTRRPSSRRTR